jgi:hypothetical protein
LIGRHFNVSHILFHARAGMSCLHHLFQRQGIFHTMAMLSITKIAKRLPAVSAMTFLADIRLSISHSHSQLFRFSGPAAIREFLYFPK